MDADGSKHVMIYSCRVNDGALQVIISQDNALWHLSISHSGGLRPSRYPVWDEITDARYTLLPKDITMAMILPPPEQYVNVHETTFHLWEIP